MPSSVHSVCNQRASRCASAEAFSDAGSARRYARISRSIWEAVPSRAMARRSASVSGRAMRVMARTLL
jgi:hypothetical protein